MSAKEKLPEGLTQSLASEIDQYLVMAIRAAVQSDKAGIPRTLRTYLRGRIEILCEHIQLAGAQTTTAAIRKSKIQQSKNTTA